MDDIAPADARVQRHLQTLQELAELGMKLARAVTEQAVQQAAAEAPVAGDPGLVLSRIARAVRQTIALEAKLAEDHRAGTAKRIAGESQVRAARGKRQVKALVERAIDADADQTDTENLFFDLVERLEVDYDDADFADRPVAELVQRICRDLGVTIDPSLWEDRDGAVVEADGLSPAKRDGEGGERADAGFSAVAPGPAMTQSGQALTRPSG